MTNGQNKNAFLYFAPACSVFCMHLLDRWIAHIKSRELVPELRISSITDSNTLSLNHSQWGRMISRAENYSSFYNYSSQNLQAKLFDSGPKKWTPVQLVCLRTVWETLTKLMLVCVVINNLMDIWEINKLQGMFL